MKTEGQDLLRTSGRKVYAAPKVVVYGTLEEITLNCNKDLGCCDGFTFQQQQINCTS
jgi:hypothetical protein